MTWIDLIIRDVCEMGGTAEGPGAVKIDVNDLRIIIERHAPSGLLIRSTNAVAVLCDVLKTLRLVGGAETAEALRDDLRAHVKQMTPPGPPNPPRPAQQREWA